MKLIIGSDHGGFQLKKLIKEHLAGKALDLFDAGPDTAESSDYSAYALKVGRAVSKGEYDRGILICGTGLGMSMAANRIHGVRAAVCTNEYEARMSRAHNDANVLCLGERVSGPGLALSIVNAWLETEFENGERHRRRIAIFDRISADSLLAEVDPEINEVILCELERQRNKLQLIASENFASPAVLAASASVMTNKYAEGYPGARYYGGCEYVDQAETLAVERAQRLFGAEYVNVQPHSGSQANMAAYFTVMQPGDAMLGMDLANGGHLTHGSRVNFSGKLFRSYFYGVDRETETIDHNEVARLAREHRPKIIVVGASAYPRTLDFKAFADIAAEVGAVLIADMAHIAGLVAAAVHPSPVPQADIVTTTTHKTLRGPRGGMILARAEYGPRLAGSVFPGIQGGPLMHVIAAKAVALKEAMSPDFVAYQQQTINNARRLAESLKGAGLRIVSGGTDNHLILVDLRNKGLTGLAAEQALDKAGIITNKNAVPYDPAPPKITSGLRLGTPALTTRGFREPEMDLVAQLIIEVLERPNDEGHLSLVRAGVRELCGRFPLYEGLGDL
ncbi:MAG: ribose 5-phosphate isomerase B [Pseudomonadota bacterium]